MEIFYAKKIYVMSAIVIITTICVLSFLSVVKTTISVFPLGPVQYLLLLTVKKPFLATVRITMTQRHIAGLNLEVREITVGSMWVMVIFTPRVV